MRLIARLPDTKQASFLVDSLRKIGFDRKDMIISDLADNENRRDFEEFSEEISFIKTEREGLGESHPFANGIKDFQFKNKTGILVAIEAPKKESDKIRSIMEQNGALEIIQD